MCVRDCKNSKHIIHATQTAIVSRRGKSGCLVDQSCTACTRKKNKSDRPTINLPLPKTVINVNNVKSTQILTILCPNSQPKQCKSWFPDVACVQTVSTWPQLARTKGSDAFAYLFTGLQAGQIRSKIVRSARTNPFYSSAATPKEKKNWRYK